MPTPATPAQPAAVTVDAEFTAMLADARRVALAMVPRPRTGELREAIDLTAAETLRIPDTTVSLLDGYADYGV